MLRQEFQRRIRPTIKAALDQFVSKVQRRIEKRHNVRIQRTNFELGVFVRNVLRTFCAPIGVDPVVYEDLKVGTRCGHFV